MKTMITLVVVTLGLLWSQAQVDAQQGQTEASKLLGSFQIVSGERSGEKIVADELKGLVVRIGDNAITTFDKDSKKIYAATYELDTSRKPWPITMTATITPMNGEGVKADGLIKMAGDTVQLIYTLPGGKTPTEFKTHEQQQMFTLKRSDQ